MAFLYVDPRSGDVDALSSRCRLRTARAGYHLRGEEQVVEALLALAAGRATWARSQETLRELLGLSGARALDERIQRALDVLHAEAGNRPSLEALAQIAGLSPSRFIHLFKAATGVTLRRYKLWLAMAVALRSMKRGETLTEAALEGGFSSSAHFSSAFREMFGLEPSRLWKRAGRDDA